MFRAKAMVSRQKEIEELKAKLERSKKQSKVAFDALKILDKKGELTLETQGQFTKEEITTLLK
jgi:hypothetical protein